MRETDTHIYFWGSFLSNFWWTDFSIKINDKEERFNTSEQAFMAFKALQFGDIDSYEQILKTPDGKSVKALGRKVKHFHAETWDKVSYRRMFLSCLAKFTQDEKCNKALIDTGNKILVEASPVDRIWGVGLSETDNAILDDRLWRGENRLGKVLMDVRSLL